MNPLPLSFIAEYQYCPRSAFYMLTDAPQSREENDYIQSGRAVHQKVDEGYTHTKGTKKVKSSVKIYSEKYAITGKTDILEFHESGEIIPVELKRGKQRKNPMHEIQLALMGLCLREMYPETIVKQGAIFFTEDRQKRTIPFTTELLSKAEEIAKQVVEKVRKGIQPKDFPALKDRRCNGCCFYDLCFF